MPVDGRKALVGVAVHDRHRFVTPVHDQVPMTGDQNRHKDDVGSVDVAKGQSGRWSVQIGGLWVSGRYHEAGIYDCHPACGQVAQKRVHGRQPEGQTGIPRQLSHI